MRELIVDSFAGGGGASTGIEMALGRSPDFAINHDPEAMALHAANHPETKHLSKNIYKVDPMEVVGRQPVGLLWASPDCKHFSKAKGGKPVKRTIRDLAWTVVLWAQRARPRVIILENVEEFKDWGPLRETEPGKFVPCPERKGQEFLRWVQALKRNGYKVEWRELRACDYGAPTTRKRLFVIARRDGEKIVWPKPTHGDPESEAVKAGKLEPWRTAAEIIDWLLPCPSIFDTSEEIMAKHGVRAVRPLADNTYARIFKGVERYVIKAAKPFIVDVAHSSASKSGVKRWGDGIKDPGTPMGNVTAGGIQQGIVVPHVMTMRNAQKPHTAGDEPTHTVTAGGAGLSLVAAHLSAAQQGGSIRAADSPLHTVTASPKDQNQVIAASMIQTGYGERQGQEPRALDPDKPLGTVVAGGAKHAAVAAFLAQHNTDVVGHAAEEPVSTIVQKGCTQAVVSAHLMTNTTGHPGAHADGLVPTVATGGHHAVVSAGLMNMKGSDRRQSDVAEPTPSITAQGNHVAEVRAFLMKYYGNEQEGHDPAKPLGAVTTRDRFGLVTVEGQPYQIVDIGMRMLTPRELFKAQGFPEDYVIDEGEFDGERRALTKTAQVRMCGNSVCPPIAAALVAANCADMAIASKVAAE